MLQKKTKKFLQNFGLLLLVVIVMFIFLEIFIRFFFPQNLNYTMFDSTLMYRHIPDFEVRFGRQEFSNLIKFNSKGLRDYEYEYEKPKDIFRVLLLGSSFSQALHVNLNETYENLLEKKLNSNMEKKYEVINSAVGGYGTAQEFFYLKTEGLKYKPDMILLDFSMRDIIENSISPLVSIENGKLIEHIPVKASLPKRLMLFCSRYAHLCSLAQTTILENVKKNGVIRPLLVKIRISSGKAHEKRTVDFEEVYSKNNTPEFTNALNKTFLLITKIKNIADANDIPIVMFIIPTREQVDESKYNEFIKINNLDKNNLDPAKVQKLVMNFARENQIDVIDMLPYFKQKNINNTFYFNIDGHWNAKGHELAANLLYNYLSNYLKNGKKQTS